MGLGVVGLGVYRIAAQEPPNWGAGAVLAVFGGVFGLVGLYVMTHGRRRVSQANAARERLEANKDTPWAQREDWAADYRRPDDRSSGAVWMGERDTGVQVERRAQGIKEFYFPPGRNVGAATGLTCFTAVWSGAIWLMLELGASFLFPVFFGLIDALLIAACASMWLGSTRTLIDGRTITIQSRILGIGSTKRIPVGEIDGVDLSIGMQSGRTPYYDIIVRYRGDRKVSLGSSIKDKREAERILDEMKSCLPEVQTDPVAEEEAVLT